MKINTVRIFLFLLSLWLSTVLTSTAATFTVSNTNNAGAGSLRQAISNANAIAGPHTIVFNIDTTDAGFDASRGVFTITLTSLLPQITRDGVTIDGNTQTVFRGNLNDAMLGTGGTVGTDSISFAQFDGPEIEITDGANLDRGIDVFADDCTIRHIAIYGFGTDSVDYVMGNIHGGDFATPIDNLTIEFCIVGTLADSLVDPQLAPYNNSNNCKNISLRRASNCTFQNNLIVYGGSSGISALEDCNNITIRYNEASYNGIGTDNFDGLDISQRTNVGNIYENRLEGNGACGLDIWEAIGDITIQNNTIINNGVSNLPVQEAAGLRVFGVNNTIEKNIFHGNYLHGVMVVGSIPSPNSPALQNRISQNSFYNNTGNAIDIVASGGSDEIGDGISLNNGTLLGDASVPNTCGIIVSSGNADIDFPVIDNINRGLAVDTVVGRACPNSTVEIYRAISGAGDWSAGNAYGEGYIYLGSTTADGSGNFNYVHPSFSNGDVLSAIVIDVSDNTSEFARNFTVSNADNQICGNVYIDINRDTIKNEFDNGQPDIMVYLYEDLNGNAQIDAGEGPIDSVLTNSVGDYVFTVNNSVLNLSRAINSSTDDVEEKKPGGEALTTGVVHQLAFTASAPGPPGFQWCGFRFQNITIPPGAVVSNAYIQFQAFASHSVPTSVTIYGEDADNPGTYNTTNYNLSTRTTTSSGVTWNIPAWILDTIYQSPDFSNVLNEIIERPGWNSGNALALMTDGLSGERWAYAWDDPTVGTEPVLFIEYVTAPDSFLVVVDTSDIDPNAFFITDSILSVVFTSSGEVSCNNHFGYAGIPTSCYAVSDNTDELFAINYRSGLNYPVGGFGVPDIEAIAFSYNADTLFAADANQLGYLDIANGNFTALPMTFGSGNGAQGNVTYSDVDGLTVDKNRVMWGSVRRGSDWDLLIKINQSTGEAIDDAFGPGIDYVEIRGSGVYDDIDDIAIDPISFKLYGYSNSGGSNGALVVIDTTDGSAVVKGANPAAVDDIEGLGFVNSGQMFATKGSGGDYFYTVDTTAGTFTQRGTFVSGGDFEACDCMILPLNSAPIAVNDNIIAITNDTTTIDVLHIGIDDFDINGDTIYLLGGGTNGNNSTTFNGGSLILNNNGSPSNPFDDFIEYVSATNFAGVDSFLYVITDSIAGNDTGTVYITIFDDPDIRDPLAPNDSLFNDTLSMTVNINDDTTFCFPIVDRDDINYDFNATPIYGPVTTGAISVPNISPNDTCLRYVAPPIGNKDTISMQLCDAGGLCDTITLLIAIIGPEICNDGIDNDNDALIDCSDSTDCVPNTPGVITTSNDTICEGAIGESYSIAAVPGATSYDWTVPAGATITVGQGTTTIAVNWGNTAGNVCVRSFNGSCYSDFSCSSITVNSPPSNPGAISH